MRVREGCELSLLLFSFYISRVTEDWKNLNINEISILQLTEFCYIQITKLF
jgi:hypothetical protein